MDYLSKIEAARQAEMEPGCTSFVGCVEILSLDESGERDEAYTDWIDGDTNAEIASAVAAAAASSSGKVAVCAWIETVSHELVALYESGDALVEDDYRREYAEIKAE